MNRRNFLKGASMLSLGALAACNSKDAAATSAVSTDKGLGLQIYTLGPELTQGDLSANFQKIRSFGIKYLELAGYNAAEHNIGGVALADFKQKAEDAGLKIISSHVTPGALFARGAITFADMKEDILEAWKPIAEDHAKLGVEYLVQPMMPMSGMDNEDQVKSFADLLNETGKVVKSTGGMQFGYHNHNMEFCVVTKDSTRASMGNIFTRPRDGKMIEDIFMDNTDPQNVIFELDTYWSVMGQQDPVEWLTNRADRIHMLHIKDRMVVGQSGMLNFKNIFDKFYANGRKYFFIEIEDTNSGKQFDRLQASAQYLNESPFVK